MRTITEFAGSNIKNAAKSKQDLTTAGKTAEELPAALGEALKVEGDRLTHLLNALETAGEKLNDLKRVVVFALAEGEKAPQGAQQKGETYYLCEYYPPLNPPKQKGKFEGRGDKKGGKRGRGGKRGGRGGGRDQRGGRREAGDGAQTQGQGQSRDKNQQRGPKPKKDAQPESAKKPADQVQS